MRQCIASLLSAALFSACGVQPPPPIAQPGQSPDQYACFKRHVIDDSGAGADGVHLADLNRDGFPEVVSGWEESAELKVYFHPGESVAQHLQHWPSVDVRAGQDVRAIEDAAFADLDNDGVVDAVLSATEGEGENINRRVRIHQWDSELPAAEPASWTANVLHRDEPTERFMKVRSAQLDGQFGADIVAISRSLREDDSDPEDITRSGGVFLYRSPPLSETADPNAWQREQLAELNKGKSIELLDMDEDGDTDILYAGARNIAWLENPLETEPHGKWRSHWIGSASDLAVCDINADGIRDIVATASKKEYPVIARWFQGIHDKSRKRRRWQAHDIRIDPPLPLAPWQPDNFSIKSIACGAIVSDHNAPADIVLTTSGSGYGIVLATAPEGFTQDYSRPWRASPVTAYQWLMKYDNILAVDIDADGDSDLVTSEENEGWLLRGAGVLWYENTRCQP